MNKKIKLGESYPDLSDILSNIPLNEEIFIEFITQDILKMNYDKPDNYTVILDLLGGNGGSFTIQEDTTLSPFYYSMTYPEKTFDTSKIRGWSGTKSFTTPNSMWTPKKGTSIRSVGPYSQSYYRMTHKGTSFNLYFNTKLKEDAEVLKPLIDSHSNIEQKTGIPILFNNNSKFLSFLPFASDAIQEGNTPIMILQFDRKHKKYVLEVLYPFQGGQSKDDYNDWISNLKGGTAAVYYVSWFLIPLKPSINSIITYLRNLKSNNQLNELLQISYKNYNNFYSRKLIKSCCTNKISEWSSKTGLGFFCDLADLQPTIDNNQCEFYMDDICKPLDTNNLIEGENVDMSQDKACACYSTYEKHNDTDKQIAQVYKQNNRNVSPKCIYTDCAGGDSYKTASIKNAVECPNICISGIFASGNKFGDINVNNTTISAACGNDGLYLCTKKCEEGEKCQQNAGNDKTGTCVRDPDYNKPVKPVEPVTPVTPVEPVTPNPVDPNPVDQNPVDQKPVEPVKKSKTLLIVIILSILLLLFILLILFL